MKINRLELLLFFALILQAISFFIEGNQYGTSVGSLLLVYGKVDPSSIDLIEQFFLYSQILLLPIVIFFRVRALLVFHFVWPFLLAISTTLDQGSFGYQWTIISHAGRILLPIGLFYSSYFKTKSNDRIITKIFLVAIAGTFIGHGLSCLFGNPLFDDYLIDFCDSFLGVVLSDQQSKTILFLIGSLDILAAVLIFKKGKGMALSYMFFWGALTAIYRIIYHGDLGIMPFLVRTSHWVIPLYLILKLNILNTFKFKRKLIKSQEVSL